MTRGDALASAVAAACDRYCEELSYDAGDMRRDLVNALRAYRAKPTGERVRLAVWYARPGSNGPPIEIIQGYDPDDAVWDDCDEPHFYIEATIPPRAEPVVVEGEIDG